MIYYIHRHHLLTMVSSIHYIEMCRLSPRGGPYPPYLPRYPVFTPQRCVGSVLVVDHTLPTHHDILYSLHRDVYA